MTFVKRFGDLIFGYYDMKHEEALMEIGIRNIILDCIVYLENMGISQFSKDQHTN